ncbi:hypothetical protein J6590_024566 [Homalodisca vitripennis]|nr:hypothetical protein J6590_024566 [Homalodisca vitripennis]
MQSMKHLVKIHSKGVSSFLEQAKKLLGVEELLSTISNYVPSFKPLGPFYPKLSQKQTDGQTRHDTTFRPVGS